jgi:hypothetical protein
LGIKLKLEGGEVVVKTEGLKYKTRTAVGIGRFLTQKLIHYEIHKVSLMALQGNEVSNAMVTNIYPKRSDAFLKFVAVARADCLPTPANVGRWFPNRSAGPCR